MQPLPVWAIMLRKSVALPACLRQMLPLRAAFALATRHPSAYRLLRSIASTPPPPPAPISHSPHVRPSPSPRTLAVYRKRVVAGMLTATSAGLMSAALFTPAPLIPSFFVERRGLLTGVGSAADQTLSVDITAAAHCIPHPSKANKPGGTGEDAFFVSRAGNFFGVADGVGGWANWGVDPALYAKALMAAALRAVDANPELSPHEILQQAYKHPSVKKVIGTSTACVASIKGSTVRVANVGDSGAMLVRDGVVAHRTREQQHSFNCPFQLGTDSNDTPEHADLYEWPGVQRGDVLIMATDGVFDNLFDDSIAAEVAAYLGSKSIPQPSDLAQRIAKKAFQNGSSDTAHTPFWSKPGAPRGGRGGKLDDITVLVAIAGSASPLDSPKQAP